MSSEDLVFEFYVKSITCKNMKSISSPLCVNITGCQEIIWSPVTTTICKLTYNRGKRIVFNQTNFQDIKTDFILQQGHGDPTIRASCTFDFYEVYSSNDDDTPTVFNVEAGLNDPNGEPFGTLELQFQIFQYNEFESLMTARKKHKASTRPSTSLNTARVSFTARSQTATVLSAARTPRNTEPGTPVVPKLKLNSTSVPTSARSYGGSTIYDRYLNKNQMWLGTRASTHIDPGSARSSTRKSSHRFEFSK